MNRWAQSAIITVLAAGSYVGLRSLPDAECVFLHYEPPVVDGDGVEYCGNDDPVFIAVKELKYPVEFDVLVDGEPRQGESTTVNLRVATRGGKPLNASNLAITHTELMHVLVVDPTREDYHHVHPEPLGSSGDWQFQFTPQLPGNYQVFAEFVPSRTRQVVIASGEIEVAAGEVGFSPAPPPGLPEGWSVSLDVEPATPAVNQAATLRLSISRDDGELAILEPVMGAWAHLVAFDEDVRGFAHLHPKFTGKEKSASPEFEFVLNTHLAGAYRIWAQVKVDGEERFVPFDVDVAGLKTVAAL